MLVDTGAQGMLVTPEIAVHLQLPLRGIIPVFGTGGQREARVVLLPGFRIADTPMPDQLAPVAPLPIDFQLNPPLAGLLGASLLSNFDLDIDVPGRRLSLYAPSACETPFGGTTLPLEVTPRGEPFVPVRINGQELLALLDTGTRATILSDETARRLSIQAPASANMAEGIDGTRRAIGHTRVRLALGNEAAADTPISISALQLARGDMLLGLDAFVRRRVWLSYRRGQVVFGALLQAP